MNFAKILLALLAFLAMILATLFSSGCDGKREDISVSDVVSRDHVHTSDDGELVLPADMNRRIDAEGWENAMKPEEFENVTMTSYRGDVDKTSGSVVKIDGDKSFEIATGGMADETGSYTVKNDMYFYRENGKNYRVVFSEKINQSTGEVTKETIKQEDEEFGGITPEYLVSGEGSLIAFVSNKFDKFLYSDKISCYAQKIYAADYPETDIVDMEIHVGFLDGKLDFIRYKRLNDENATFYSTYFSDYGKTVIEIPEVE